MAVARAGVWTAPAEETHLVAEGQRVRQGHPLPVATAALVRVVERDRVGEHVAWPYIPGLHLLGRARHSADQADRAGFVVRHVRFCGGRGDVGGRGQYRAIWQILVRSDSDQDVTAGGIEWLIAKQVVKVPAERIAVNRVWRERVAPAIRGRDKLCPRRQRGRHPGVRRNRRAQVVERNSDQKRRTDRYVRRGLHFHREIYVPSDGCAGSRCGREASHHQDDGGYPTDHSQCEQLDASRMLHWQSPC